MKNYKILLFTFLIVPMFCFSQEQTKDSIVDKPERDAFESSSLVDNQTNVLFNKNTLEVMMQHRFDDIGRENSLLGLYGSANIRIGATYSFLDWLTVGYGITKTNITSDFNVKVALLRQTRSGRIPLSITYYGNAAIDGRSGSEGDNVFFGRQNRYSYYHQIIFAKRFSPKLSLQFAPSMSHFNAVFIGDENDQFTLSFGGRYKISDQTSFMVDYSVPMTKLPRLDDDPDPRNGYGLYSRNAYGLSLGFEFSTSGHAFQLFITNLKGILPQYNNMRNINKVSNGFNDNGMLIGFNITRRYNF